MIADMKPKKFSFLCRWVAIIMLALAPASAMAQDDEGSDIYDARLEGYAGSVTLPQSSSGLTWVIFIVLMVIAAGGLFKDAKRSHLD
jgi:hypothetical protein